MFVDEITLGTSSLYGKAAGEEYQKEAFSRVQATIAHPMVDALAIVESGHTVGLLFSAAHDNLGQIFFIHVLDGMGGRGIEERLIHEAVTTLRSGGVDGILSECIPFSELNDTESFEKHGFEAIARALMIAPLDDPALLSTGPCETRIMQPDDYESTANTIMAAYKDHPSRKLHHEVTTIEGTMGLIANITSGGFGDFRPEYARVMEAKGHVVGALLGCQVAAGTGFIVQVTVHPNEQGRGLGEILVRETAQSFRDAGLHQAALGVTLNNPARMLYERLGFTIARYINAHVWWRP